MKAYTPEELLEVVGKKLMGKPLTLPQKEFLQQQVLTPFLEKISKEDELFWFAPQKQTTTILVNQPVSSEVTKTYLQLFNHDASDFWFITSKGLVVFNIIQFLEEGVLFSYPYLELTAICLGRQYGPDSLASHNPPVIGVFTKTKAYNLGGISELDKIEADTLLSQLPQAKNLYIKLTDFGLLGFIKKWQKRA